MPEAIKVRKLIIGERGLVVTVAFDDGRKVTFFPAYGGFGDPVSIAELRIEELRDRRDQAVATFYSPNQSPINVRNCNPDEPDFGFQRVELCLSLAQIAEYLAKAVERVAEGFAEKPSRYAEQQRIVCLAANEIAQICRGEFPLPV